MSFLDTNVKINELFLKIMSEMARKIIPVSVTICLLIKSPAVPSQRGTDIYRNRPVCLYICHTTQAMHRESATPL